MATRKDNTPKSFREVPCARCGDNFKSTGPNHKRCDPCKVEHKREYERENKRLKAMRLSACQRCGEAFPPTVHAHRRHCLPCGRLVRNEQAVERYFAEPEKHREYGRRHYEKKRDGILEKRRTPEQRKALWAIEKRRRARDPGLRVHMSFSRLIGLSLNGDKGGRRWQDLVGYTLEELRRHLERQFTKGMTWDNYGEWHIDHIRPRASFSFTSSDDPDFRQCWALTNLRPLWKAANISKGAKRLHLL